MIAVDILYEDNHLVAINKPAGVLVQGDHTGDICLIDLVKNYLRSTYNKQGNIFCGCIHRLDRPVSGLVLFAKTSKALERMNKIFSSRDIIKTYHAIVEKKPLKANDQLTHYIIKNEIKNVVKAFNNEVNNSLKAILDYHILEKTGDYYLLQINPHTGRPHQIRVQLSSIGCPIIGDLKYGAKKPLSDGMIALHSNSLEFIHPIKKEKIKIIAPYPKKDYWSQIK